MIDARQMRADVNELLTCAPHTACPHESACFRVARALRALLPDPIDEHKPDDDAVDYYAPDWSAA